MPLTDDEIQRIYLHTRTRLHAFFSRRLQCPDTAADLVQDLYFRLPKLQPAPCTGQEVRNWLFRVAANLSVDYVRAEQRHAGLLEEHYGGKSDIDEAATPEQAASASEQLRALQAALSELPDRCADILYLSRVEGLTYPEIAARLGISTSLVEKEIVRALNHCRRARDEEDHD
ncbi:RNA polymerase sigma factor [Methylocaldum szegediense]|uniref:RNA polymerase sigma factor n=1 Tax=Methylocaldum szegediense TaxID=73780 RepID=UPI000416EAFA|nr:RNA polymerase sigma factor [Methylocaldum szegediense]